LVVDSLLKAWEQLATVFTIATMLFASWEGILRKIMFILAIQADKAN
jgi:hypothetical protein